MRRTVVIATLLLLTARAGAQGGRKLSAEEACELRALDTPGQTFCVNPNENKPHGDAALIAGATQRIDAILAILKETFPGQKGFDLIYDRVMSKLTEGTIEAYHVDASLYAYSCPKTGGGPAPPDLDHYGRPALTVKIGVNSNHGLFLREKELPIDGKMRKVYETFAPVGEVAGFRMYGEAKPMFRKVIWIARPGAPTYLPITRRQYTAALLQLAKEGKWTLSRPNPQGRAMPRADADVRRDVEEMEAYLAKTPAAELDLPARGVTPIGMWHWFGSTDPAFSDEPGAREFVVLAPGYFRRDVPKHVPQLIVLEWEGGDGTAAETITRRFWANFPGEKLRALIDK